MKKTKNNKKERFVAARRNSDGTLSEFKDSRGKVYDYEQALEAVEKGMDDVSIALGILDGEIISDPNKLTPNEKLHGKVVDTRMDPYHDVTIYEDGYEERYYIGD